MARWFAPYRLVTYLLIIFCAAHTIGGLFTPHSFGLAADGVLLAMKAVHFNQHGADCTYYGFHLGFGLMLSVLLLACAALAWVLAGQPAARLCGRWPGSCF